jgi:lathosterol oxidase
MAQTFTSLSAPQVMLWGVLFFGGIYLGFGALTWLLTKRVLPALGIGRVLDPRPLQPGQLRRELGQSGVSVLIFGLGMVFPWGLLQLGWARLDGDARWRQVALEILVLAVWNDVHFWLNHRLLHTRWLRRFHGPHHRSFVTTPWATYSFHPIEALMLGNVILLPMVVHDFSFWALAAVPVFSLFFNCIGHSNYDFFTGVSYSHWFAASRRHHLHHAMHNGNYGFQFTFMDRLFAPASRPTRPIRSSRPFTRKCTRTLARRMAQRPLPEARHRLQRLRNWRDWQSLVYLAALPALAAWQWVHGFSAVLYALMLFLTLGVGVIHHNHVHLRMWRGRRMNRLTDFWITLLQAIRHSCSGPRTWATTIATGMVRRTWRAPTGSAATPTTCAATCCIRFRRRGC